MEILILAAAFTVAGLMLVAGIPALEYYRVFHTGMPVDAVVSARTEKNGKIYITWDYSIGSTHYVYKEKHGRRTDERKEGDRGAVLTKKGCPAIVYELISTDRKVVFCVIGGLLLLGAMLLVTVWMYGHGMARNMILL